MYFCLSTPVYILRNLYSTAVEYGMDMGISYEHTIKLKKPSNITLYWHDWDPIGSSSKQSHPHTNQKEPFKFKFLIPKLLSQMGP